MGDSLSYLILSWFDLLFGFSEFFVIDQRDEFGFGFSTLS